MSAVRLRRVGVWRPRIDLPGMLRRYGAWLFVAGLLAALNVILWRGVVQPQLRALTAWRDLEVLAHLQPQLVASLGDSGRTVMEWQRTVFSTQDPSAVVETVRRLADQFHVDVQDLTSRSAGKMDQPESVGSGFSTMEVEVKASGPFGKLARWMSAVEQLSGLQLDAWTLTGAAEPGQPHHLAVKLTAILRGAS